MAKKRKKSSANKEVKFADKLVLNQWLISLFGIDPLEKQMDKGREVRPFHKLSERVEDCREGFADDGLHHFFHELMEGDFWLSKTHKISKEMLLVYEERIAEITREINAKRRDATHGNFVEIKWKYYQWLSLLFVEIYLDKFFANREALCAELNEFLKKFNAAKETEIKPYNADELNKICLQCATGSGKTLLMIANTMQYKFYEKRSQKKSNGYTFIITPNERLAEQDRGEFANSYPQGSIFNVVPYGQKETAEIYSIELSKLKDKDGEKTVNTRALGNENFLIIDEGHAGLSGKETGAWYKARQMMCENGFAFEYSATFRQAVTGTEHEDDYAKAILFDYSYRWFYEDGYGKDYQIFNIPNETEKNTKELYLTGGLLKFFQQMKIFTETPEAKEKFNIEKPLWVWVGHSVSGGSKKNKSDEEAISDIGKILRFIAKFLKDPARARNNISDLLTKDGSANGLLIGRGNETYDLFSGAFKYLEKHYLKTDLEIDTDGIYHDIIKLVFQADAAGRLVLERIKGDSGEIALKADGAEKPFGLINVSGASELCAEISANPAFADLIEVRENTDTAPMFAKIRQTDSPINLLIGAKKFIEGWDCWRVSTLGMLNVGKQEGVQIIQLFGRGVRLKGCGSSLKRSSCLPQHVLRKSDVLGKSELQSAISELELFGVFGVSADAMEQFKKELKEEGLPGNEIRETITIPLTVSDLDNKKLKVLRPKKRKDNGKEYNFKQDGPVPEVNGKNIPARISEKDRVEVDWYPRIAAQTSAGKNAQINTIAQKNVVSQIPKYVFELLDFDELYFEAEHWKRQNAKYNLNVSIGGIRELFTRNDWYHLLIPSERLNPKTMQDVFDLQEIVKVLLRKYLDKFYEFCKDAYWAPRLELKILSYDDANIPEEREYQIVFDASDESLREKILKIKGDLEKFAIGNASDNLSVFECTFGDTKFGGTHFENHLFNPLLFTSGSKIKIAPCSLNESEWKFVKDLKKYVHDNRDELKKRWDNIFLLRNQSRGRGIGFFEADNFYPDFILWCLKDGKQFVNFIEPHGLMHSGSSDPKIRFAEKIKDIERRIGEPDVVLNSFIISPTEQRNLNWGDENGNKWSTEKFEEHHVFFQADNSDGEPHYIAKMLSKISQENGAKN